MPFSLLPSSWSPAGPPTSRAVRADGSRGRVDGAVRRARLRRLVSALLAAATVVGVGRLALDRPLPGSVRVVVASTQVAAGTPLSTAVVTVRDLPGNAIPEGAVADLEEVVGRPAASVLTTGEVVTDLDLGTSTLLTGQAEGTRAVFLPMAEPVVLATLGAGDRVDVHSPVGGSVVASDVLVLSVHREGTTGSWGQGGGARTGGGVWLAVRTATAEQVAAALGADPAGGSMLLSLRPSPG